ncbi:hypothetical protein SCMU_00250 [Sinomonas cyclohexanicum]|uniref:Uncharacterized protein n=1 Tax=Sinomonas cyclohexanicum TaxID=322009 RepID=A0ABM7PPQ4_SINCY|nr:hypothetical protein [Corynebacterium cyclohexanicum]BCT74183.1 hypothetical protein SCMU_00250 [Corynebacterium cyclohexanicum]
MSDETDGMPEKVHTSRVVSKKAANRIAAAKAYVAAMKKAGQEAPESVKKLATMDDETGTIPRKVPTSRVVTKKAANRAAAAKVYVVAMKKAGEEAPEWIKELAKRSS